MQLLEEAQTECAVLEMKGRAVLVLHLTDQGIPPEDVMTRLCITATLALLAIMWPSYPRAASNAYQVDPANSRVTIAVGKSGAFSFLAGHKHEVSGPIESGTIDVDPGNLSGSRVSLAIATSSLKVSGADEPPEDRPKVQEAMESEQVLGVARYPRITFESTGVTGGRSGTPTLDVVVAGRLTIRDVTRSVSVPVHVQLGDHSLNANARFSVRQTEFGIKPISVSGVIAVKDRLDIAFSVAAQR
jgi:polyisoprenoid-binding protein YceI